MRLTIVAVIVGCLFAALLARLWYLQVMRGDTALASAQDNGVRLVSIPAPRGRIVDRNGVVIVDNRISEVLTLSRDSVKVSPGVVDQLAKLLNTPVTAIRHAVDDKRYSPYQPVPIATDVSNATIIYIKEHRDLFPGVEAQAQAVRTYPFGAVAANVLGYVSQISDRQYVSLKAKGYQQNDQIGQTGIESAYESALRGQPAVQKLQVDAQGRVLGNIGNQPAVQGHDIKLTIDIKVQQMAEQSLQQGLQAAQGTFDTVTHRNFAAPAGGVVVEDPRNGQIIALATYPTYNPLDFVGGISQQKYAGYLNNPLFPLNDRTIQGQYAPGSTFKMVTATAALQDGLISPSLIYNDTGGIDVGTTHFRNDNGAAYGPVSLQRAITVSSDAYFYNLGAEFWSAGVRAKYGDDALQNVARSYGFGSPTGIAIPNEATGKIPDLTMRKKEHAANPVAFPNGGWFTGDNVNMAIGQGEVLVTPLQLANAYATFANGGILYRPLLALDAEDQSGQVVQTFPSQAMGHVALPERPTMLAGFEGVTSSPGGTAYGAFAGFPLDQFLVAGKTGTAQASPGKQDTSVFTSFGPAANPQYVVDAMLEQSGYGANAAAPTVRRIYDGILGHNQGAIAIQHGGQG
jgi:penicillin-binding protein 2